MPILPEKDETSLLGVKAITGKEWNETIDYVQEMTPRGDGVTTYAETTKDGTKISSITSRKANGGGASLADLPDKSNFEGESLIAGRDWNKLLDYLSQITPRSEGDTVSAKSISDGVEISFEPIEEEVVIDACPDFPFYFNITITGGSFPLTWLGQTWESSGETKAICGTGTQDANGQTWNAYTGRFSVDGSITSQTGTRSQQGRFHDIFMLLPTATTTLYPWRRRGSYTHYTIDFGYYTFTGGRSYSSTSSFQGLVTAYTPPVGSPPYPWNGTANANRILPEMNGSVTTTAGRTISWAAVPDLPWEYPAP